MNETLNPVHREILDKVWQGPPKPKGWYICRKCGCAYKYHCKCCGERTRKEGK